MPDGRRQAFFLRLNKVRTRLLAKHVDESYGEAHENGEGNKDALQPFLSLATVFNRKETALLETGGRILAMMMVMMITGVHHLSDCLYQLLLL